MKLFEGGESWTVCCHLSKAEAEVLGRGKVAEAAPALSYERILLDQIPTMLFSSSRT
jgi:hypothetical protein